MSQKLPAGRYYIGDPCYVIDNTVWSDFLEPFWDQEPRGGIFEFDGYKCAAFYTKWGDGQYELEPTGDQLPVDAGMIGAIPAILCTKGQGDGVFVDMLDDFTCQESGGTIYFGNYIVRTDDEADGDDPDYDVCSECGR